MTRKMTARVFGPVPSRRLGRSLGLDLTPAKTCTYDCRYCQLTATNHLGAERRMFFEPAELLSELREKLATIDPPDWITCSGTGEPTLYAGLGAVLRGIRELSAAPICVITNGSLLDRADVRADLCLADRVMPTLCSVHEETWRSIHRPSPDIKLSNILQGLKTFGAEFSGFLELEVFICPGLNDTPRETEDLGRFLRELPGLGAVYLNSAVRSPVDGALAVAAPDLLEGVRTALDLKIPVSTVFDHSPLPKPASSQRQPTGPDIIELLGRHPCTFEQLHHIFGGDPELLRALVSELVSTGRAERRADGMFALVS
ncbi:MAG: Cyclic pyranopterin monophosphate synthase [bacterium ADurb.Bin374]|mgnify:CR=1 FL=1|nr:MAG: Cyclic pyranopterin monophosphate synthase [bacterium ADurb.Bin374]